MLAFAPTAAAFPEQALDAVEEPQPTHAPELLAPAGDWLCARAAVENGADAVYFGLATATCFNARARAQNFTPDELPELIVWLHRRGVKGYVALNTLVFPRELEEVEGLLRGIVEAGADAVIVQDLGVARLARELCPELPLHASTQMTLSSAEAIRTVEPLGIRRVILPRELSIREIGQVRAGTGLELEVFVHGALCVAYSGQCLASRTLGGRSGNRGECAQPCRLPYQVVCDGNDLNGVSRFREGDAPAEPQRSSQCLSSGPARQEPRPPARYPLSTQDLAAYDLVPELVRAGVAAMKIEGRLKSAEYVAAVTGLYRRAIDAAVACPPQEGRHSGQSQEGRHSCLPLAFTRQEIEQLSLSFSRGFCHGWLEGPNHKALVSGRTPATRGILLGEVRAAGRGRVAVELAAAIQRGDGVVFEGDGSADAEQGGRVYEVFVDGRSVEEPVAAGVVELTFARGAIDWKKIRPGQRLFKTNDPRLDRQLRRTFTGAESRRRVALDLVVEAVAGRPLRIAGRTASGVVCGLESREPLQEAVKHPLTAEVLREQLGRLGSTTYQLRHLEARIEGRPMVPLSVLGQLRRGMVEQLDAGAGRILPRAVAEGSPLVRFRAMISADARQSEDSTTAADHTAEGGCATMAPQLHVLCRSIEQLQTILDCGIRCLVVDFPDVRRCREAVQRIREAGAKGVLATPRIQKPDEEAVFRTLADCGPDGFLVRNLGGLGFCSREGIPAVADFSLNAANELAVYWLREQGALRVTAAHDLGRGQLWDLVAAVPPEWLEVVVHQHVPMFHTEHCLFCALLSPGTDKSNCGRPCRRHEVRLRDRMGMEHLLRAEFGCRNTVYCAVPQEDAELASGLLKRGVRHFRVEFLETAAPHEVRSVVQRHRRVIPAG